MKELILATSNPGKIAELSALLAPIICMPQSNLGIIDAEENGLSFVENALIKARHASSEANRPALADDSGLVVPALHGRPGIYSARFAGITATDSENTACLLQALNGIADTERAAYFYCAIVIVQHAQDPTPLIACGKLDGYITHQPGGEHGFGYDPVFYVPQQQCTMAQLPAKIKNTLSHRAKALQQLKQQLKIYD